MTRLQRDWRARHDDIPELVTLPATISGWGNEIVAAVLTGTTNATFESLNRRDKLEARLASGYGKVTGLALEYPRRRRLDPACPGRARAIP